MERGIYTIKRISLDKVSCFLIYSEGKALLVDSGNSGSEKKILESMGLAGVKPEMLKLLVLTHSHFDHAGSAKRIKELTGCKILVHRTEADRLRKGFTALPGGTRWKAKLLVALGRAIAWRLGKYPGAIPDMVVEDTLDLQEFGFPGKVIHTPGHTHGSMVVLLANGELFAGDTLFGLKGKQHFPPFAEDLPALVQSWKRLHGLALKTIYPAHGLYFGAQSFLAEYENALKRYDR